VQSELSAEEFSSPEDRHHSGHRRKRRRSNDHRRSRSDGSDSSETVDLPARFDSHGKRVPERGEDPIADSVQDLISGLLGGGSSKSRGRK